MEVVDVHDILFPPEIYPAKIASRYYFTLVLDGGSSSLLPL